MQALFQTPQVNRHQRRPQRQHHHKRHKCRFVFIWVLFSISLGWHRNAYKWQINQWLLTSMFTNANLLNGEKFRHAICLITRLVCQQIERRFTYASFAFHFIYSFNWKCKMHWIVDIHTSARFAHLFANDMLSNKRSEQSKYMANGCWFNALTIYAFRSMDFTSFFLSLKLLSSHSKWMPTHFTTTWLHRTALRWKYAIMHRQI